MTISGVSTLEGKDRTITLMAQVALESRRSYPSPKVISPMAELG